MVSLCYCLRFNLLLSHECVSFEPLPLSRIGTSDAGTYNRNLQFLICIKRVCLNWNFIIYDLQNANYSSHGAPCSARDLFPWLNTKVKVQISVWTIREYPKRHSSYLSDSGDTFLPLFIFVLQRFAKEYISFQKKKNCRDWKYLIVIISGQL